MSQPDDLLEREADRVAEQVMTMAGPAASPAGRGTDALQRRAMAEEELQAQAATHGPAAADADAAAAAVAGGGQPLSAGLRAYFERRFGREFGDLRIHTDSAAAQASAAINARAFTLGRDIAFAAGEFAPETREGRLLIAHELSHVVQQADGPGTGVVQRQQAGPAGLPPLAPNPYDVPPEQAGPAAPQPAAPAFGLSCSGGANDPCQFGRCDNRHPSIRNDLSRAIGYVEGAVQALGATPLADDTVTALDWYFNDHSAATVDTVRERLVCIRDCLQDTSDNDRYGCHPDRAGVNAYVCVGSTPACTDAVTPVCLTDEHFKNSPSRRAQTMVHECAHRVGMSLGTPQSVADIYEHTTRFLFLDTSEAVLNADSYALFVGAIRHGVPATFWVTILPTLAGGVAVPGRGAATWQARLYWSIEAQHPVLGLFNPTLQLGVSVIGETAREGVAPVSSGPSMLVGLLPGIRIGDPRPGAAGGGYVSIFGGPALATTGGGVLGIGATEPLEVDIGAEAGVALGYRWRWLDASLAPGYTYDPTREAGMEDLFTLSATLTFLPGHD